jgi:mannose-6-phosphate isomerase
MTTTTGRLIELPSHRIPDRFYRGGAAIGRFRGHEVAATHEPEDWVASTTCVHGETRLGLSTLPDGRLLRDAVESDPDHWLGRAHTKRFGSDPMILVKLLDAGERLPVHAHPDRGFARTHLGSNHGKAEAWYILEGGTVHLGLTRELDREGLLALLAADEETLLAALTRIEVSPGDVVYVPPGTLHAIGEGVLLVEVQEASDLSIMLEHARFGLDPRTDGHLGLGYPAVLDAVDGLALAPGRRAQLVYAAGAAEQLLPVEADAYFRLERVRVDRARRLAPGFCVIVVTRGAVQLRAGSEVTELARGATLVVPHAAGSIVATGDGELLVCRPPRVHS